MIVTTNLPFSEWTQMIPNGQLCKALIDRHHRLGAHHRDRARFLPLPQTLEKRKGRTSVANMSYTSPPLAAEKKELMPMIAERARGAVRARAR